MALFKTSVGMSSNRKPCANSDSCRDWLAIRISTSSISATRELSIVAISILSIFRTTVPDGFRQSKSA